MKLQFLGTGAADWVEPKKPGEKYYRRMSSALVDDCLLIDPGPGVIDAIEEFCIDVNKIKYMINTHDHNDHIVPETVEYLKSKGVLFIETPHEGVYDIGKYKVTALKGNHTVDVMHFIISDGDKKLFYALDGAWLMLNEVEAIQREHIDYAVFDATVGFIDGDYRIFEHNNLYMVIEMKRSLDGYINRFCISHMAKTLHKTHIELCQDMREHGIETAYDGMAVEI